ncbi:DNA-directed RNA polymerase III subunit RPC4, putative [Plasmodium malariae]|uniref:DNA-directed RNA polymerase III subunit RPC4, putative n=1 Tax=Plasmodium malariae TaxID=5858 RepID=A0A1D3SPV4_PLAMA|nr:DNA-directed RNA polymerase III subunit RPC4, putative [Plasmodium malariae]SCO93938.1 DNA-directed RNA polymerase III subunit RPC4, putative [Plasmodium malariae]
MNNRHNYNEYSLRRSINNALRNKSNHLKNGASSNKNSTLKKFVPNIDNLKNENKIKNDEVDKLEDSLSNKSIQELIKKTISVDLQKETKKNENYFNNNKIINKVSPFQGIEETLNDKVNLQNEEQLKENNNDDECIDQKSIDIYELNNISKNIFYNKKCISSDVHFLPLTLPFFNNNEKQKKIRKLFLNKEPFFFYIQLPNMLPAVIQNDDKNEAKENMKQKGEKDGKKDLQTGKGDAQKDEKEEKEIKHGNKKFEKPDKDAYKLSNINTIPNGKFAKLIIYKNKKIKMKINDILFDVNEGSECTFSQEIGCYIKENSEFIFLGNCDNKVVVTPNIERIINNK